MIDQLKALTQLGPMMAKAREMQSKIQEVQARLPQMQTTGSASGGGLVTAVANGNMELVSLDLCQCSCPINGHGIART